LSIADSHEFAPWPTAIAEVRVELRDLTYDAFKGELIASFDEIEGPGKFRALFADVGAFRVLDEHGLLELWDPAIRRPAFTTFRVRNHLWSKESEISFLYFTKDRWSYMIATVGDCLEVLTQTEPRIVVL
jgi:hypothetical protein